MSVSDARPRSILDNVEIEYPHRVANWANVTFLARRTLRTIAPRSPDSIAARTGPLCQIARVESTVWVPCSGWACQRIHPGRRAAHDLRRTQTRY